MEAHLFSTNGLDIAFDPHGVQFFVVPRSHLTALRRLVEEKSPAIEREGETGRELRAFFAEVPRGGPSESFSERMEAYRNALNRLTLILTERCTLRCRYCYEGSECNPRKRAAGPDLSVETLRQGLEFVFSQYRTVGSIMFFGGEPLLRPDLIRVACRTARDIAGRRGVKLGGFSIITNGTLVTDPVIELLKEERISVTLSCDGPAAVNDVWRAWPVGEGSFRWIESTALRLKEASIPFGVQVALTPTHCRAKCGVREIGAMTSTWTNHAPHIVPAQISDRSRHAWNAGELRWLVSMYVEEARRSLQCIESGALADVLPFTRLVSILRSLIWRTGSPLRCPAGAELALGPDGWLYPCFMFAYGDSGLRLCLVSEPDTAEFWRRTDAFILANHKLANPQCSRCWVRALCNGCMGANFQAGGLAVNDEVNCTITKSLAEAIMGSLAEIQTDPVRWNAFRSNYLKMCGVPSIATECS